MPLYIADYLAKTAHLRALESGAYLHLIMHYWQHGKLPAEDRKLAAIARMTDAEWKRSRETLAEFFKPGWKHNRIDEELAHAADISSKRSISAHKRHSKSDAKADAKGDARSVQLDTHAGAGLSQSQFDDVGDARASPGCAISSEAFALSDDLMRLQRLETDDPRCIAASYAVQAWLTKGWKAEIIRSTVDIVMSKRAEAPSALRYFEKAIAAAHAEQNRPLPVAIIHEESTHVVRKNARPRGALDAIRDIQRQLEDGADSEADQYPAVGLPPG